MANLDPAMPGPNLSPYRHPQTALIATAAGALAEVHCLSSVPEREIQYNQCLSPPGPGLLSFGVNLA
jgi:hypothetical protein